MPGAPHAFHTNRFITAQCLPDVTGFDQPYFRRMKRPILYFLLLLLAASGAQAQRFSFEVPVPTERILSDDAQISLLTMLPGDEIYALFGHSAFRVHDPALGIDRVYNYGTFDFNQPYFVLRFMRGQLDYQLSVSPYDQIVPYYYELGRPVIEQVLNLTPHQKDHLLALLETNYRPENRIYRYDFFFDNCSTRLRDGLEAVVGTRLDYDVSGQARTFRDLIDPYLARAPLTDFGVDLGLGSPTDRTASPREATFLPVELMHVFGAAQVDGRPLVSRTDTLFWFEGLQATPRAFNWPLLAAWLLLLAGAVLTVLRPALARRIDAPLLGFAGIVGMIVFFLWFLTEHTVTGPNWNLLWAWPTHLAAGYFVARGRQPRWLRQYLAVAAGVAVATVACWALLPQALNPAFLPLVLLIALRCAVLAGAPLTIRARRSGLQPSV
jgi:hypothetical protein